MKVDVPRIVALGGDGNHKISVLIDMHGCGSGRIDMEVPADDLFHAAICDRAGIFEFFALLDFELDVIDDEVLLAVLAGEKATELELEEGFVGRVGIFRNRED